MPCCCFGDSDEKNAVGKNDKYGKISIGDPPSEAGIKDRGTPKNEDERVVEWWRSRNDGDDDDDVGEVSGNGNVSARDRSFDSSRNRMEERNPLEKPYVISDREAPLNPKDGDILRPSVIADRSKQGNTDASTTSEGIEVFEPSLSGPNGLGNGDHSKKMQLLSETMGTENETEKKTTKIPKKSSLKLQLPQTKNGDSNDMIKINSDGDNHEDDIPDHLSDVPSEVDSVTKERYLLACQMLKSTMIQKEKALAPLEREFILSLLGDGEGMDATSVMSEDHVTAMEKTALRLDNDPLFQDTSSSDVNPLSPMTSANLQMAEKNFEASSEVQEAIEVRNGDDGPTTKSKKAFLSMPCNPKTVKDANVSADIILIVPEEETERASQISASQLVRFDGWSFHDSTTYPFRILGADDERTEPKVMTPPVMEALRGFFPYTASESNFWLKFSLARDGASLLTLLDTVRASSFTIIGIETMHGEVFGSFTSSPWRTGTKWFGSGEAFLWRLKKSRLTSAAKSRQEDFENEMEIFPCTGYDDLVQYCTTKTIAIGGGDWLDNPCPFDSEPTGIGLMIDGDLAGGETNSCATFANPRLCKKTTASNEFSIANLEVWTMTPCLDIQEASKLEVQKLFVEENMR